MYFICCNLTNFKKHECHFLQAKKNSKNMNLTHLSVIGLTRCYSMYLNKKQKIIQSFEFIDFKQALPNSFCEYFFQIFKLAKNLIHVFRVFLACKKNEIHVFFRFFSLQKMKTMFFELLQACKK